MAKLHSIYKVPGNEDVNAILKVEWLLRKGDLPTKYDSFQSHFSIAEVFPSGQYEYVFIESLMRKCSVISYPEYEYLKNAGEIIHFSRALFNIKTHSLNPDPSLWPK